MCTRVQDSVKETLTSVVRAQLPALRLHQDVSSHPGQMQVKVDVDSLSAEEQATPQFAAFGHCWSVASPAVRRWAHAGPDAAAACRQVYWRLTWDMSQPVPACTGNSSAWLLGRPTLQGSPTWAMRWSSGSHVGRPRRTKQASGAIPAGPCLLPLQLRDKLVRTGAWNAVTFKAGDSWGQCVERCTLLSEIRDEGKQYVNAEGLLELRLSLRCAIQVHHANSAPAGGAGGPSAA